MFPGWGCVVLGTQSLHTKVPNRYRHAASTRSLSCHADQRDLLQALGKTLGGGTWVFNHTLSLSSLTSSTISLYLLRLECLQLWSLLQRAHAFADVLLQVFRRVFAFHASIFEIEVDVVLHVVLVVLLQLLNNRLLLRVVLIASVRVHQQVHVFPAGTVLRKHAQVLGVMPIQLISMFTAVKGLLFYGPLSAAVTD